MNKLLGPLCREYSLYDRYVLLIFTYQLEVNTLLVGTRDNIASSWCWQVVEYIRIFIFHKFIYILPQRVSLILCGLKLTFHIVHSSSFQLHQCWQTAEIYSRTQVHRTQVQRTFDLSHRNIFLLGKLNLKFLWLLINDSVND